MSISKNDWIFLRTICKQDVKLKNPQYLILIIFAIWSVSLHNFSHFIYFTMQSSCCYKPWEFSVKIHNDIQSVTCSDLFVAEIYSALKSSGNYGPSESPR